ncbi:MAG: XRE family transcriptional regulator [Ezakiella sp.]|uniref:helix-turn-helix domain-containing protein n=1 Tax=Ezakiella sp. TaxID=1935205 RepID=UPI002978BD41|nr:XRE family transcriptional regulator [Ezakiella sp.]MDD7730919.1 XRE family transcriptional regulator [Eubacteriales bacterium]MDY6080343.1 XRE family transcriptional regulator [Ezakiella sp.]
MYNIRIGRNLTIEEITEILNKYSEKKISKSTVHRWENNVNEPSATNLSLYSKAFNIDMNYLAGLTDVYSEREEKSFNNYVLCSDYTSAGMSADPIFYANADKIQLSDEFVGKYKGRKDLEFVKTYGDSMTNVIPEGATIGYVTDDILSQVKAGDIVLYRYGSDFGVKRYYDIGDSILFKYDSKNKEHEGKFVVYPKDEYLQIVGKVVIFNVIID